MMKAPVLAVVSAFTLLSTPSASAQRAVDTLFGDIFGGSFGGSVDGIGDITGDGVEDFIVGMNSDSTRPESAGRARIFSGSDRALLFEVLGTHPQDSFGRSVAGVGDLNADGVPDFAVGATSNDTVYTNGGMVRAFSGADGSILWTRYGERMNEQLSIGLSYLGDINGDGHCDVLAGGPATTGLVGVVRIYSGIDGGTLHEVWGDSATDLFGFEVAGVGDCTGDGMPDFAVVALSPQSIGQSYAAVYSGSSATRLFTILPVTDRVTGVSAIGDVNHDGLSDIAVGEVYGTSGGGVFVYSGFNGSVVLSVMDNVHEWLGSDLDAVGDVDGDTVPDLLVGAEVNSEAYPGAGAVKVLSGATGEVLFQVLGDYPSDHIGRVLASLDSQVLIGQPSHEGFGRVRVHALGEPVGETYCATTVNSTNRPSVIAVTGLNSISANTLTLRATYVPPGQSGLFVYSPDQAQMPLGDGTLCLGSSTQGFINRLPGHQSSPLGVLEHDLDVTAPRAPESLITAGSTWNFQAFFRDLPAGGAGFNFSDAIAVTFVP